jgi:hypothetical protein
VELWVRISFFKFFLACFHNIGWKLKYLWGCSLLAGVSLFLMVLFVLEYPPCDDLSLRSFICVAMRLEVRACLQKSMAVFL